MLVNSSTDSHQLNFFGNDLLQQLYPADPLLKLAQVISWSDFDQAFAKHYTQGIGAPSKPIRLMVGLLILVISNETQQAHLVSLREIIIFLI